MIREYSKDGLTHLSIFNEKVEAVFLPQLGSKMISLVNRKTDTEFLLANQNKDHIYKRAYFGADYALYDASGFDECFPTIEKSELLVENSSGETKKINFPDHGELWSKEWNYALSDNSLMFSTQGVNAEYTITKRIELEENSIIIKYMLRNNSGFPI